MDVLRELPRLLVAGVSLILTTASAQAGQLTYTPTNPSFGGSPLNGTYMLGAATANNYKFLQNPATQQQLTGQSAVQQFSQQITSALLSQIAANVSQQILGSNAKDSGTFSVGGEVINFNRVNGQINISITDGASGANTQIQIPVPNY